MIARSEDGLNRRQVLCSLAALAATARTTRLEASSRRHWIDVHHHFVPPGYKEFFASARDIHGSPAVMPPTAWNLSADLEDMDRAGTSTAMLSMFVPPQLGTVETRSQLARAINEGGARLVTERTGRFGLFAALPLPDVESCLREIEFAMQSLHADGFAVYTNLGDLWLGDRCLDPIFEELNRRAAVLFVHPTTANCCYNLIGGVPDNIIEFQTDTTRAIANIIFNNVSSRYPNIQFLFSHGGGTVPYLIERFLGGTSAEIIPGVRTTGQQGAYVPKQPPLGALHELQRFHYDTAQCANPIAMRALKTLVSPSQIHFGTDYFYRTALETSDALERCGVFDAAELNAIARVNTLRLCPNLATQIQR